MNNQETRIEEQLDRDFIEIDYIKQNLQVSKNLLILAVLSGGTIIFLFINDFYFIISNHYRILQLLFEFIVMINTVSLYLINHYILKESKNKNKLSKTNLFFMLD